jgi:hypothetical protein
MGIVRIVLTVAAVVSAAVCASLAQAQSAPLGGTGGVELLSNLEHSDAWVTDAKGRATGRPPWAVARGWQVYRIPNSDYNGPNEDQFLLPPGDFVLHIRVHHASYPSRILVHGLTSTQSPTGPAVCFYLVRSLNGATLTLRFSSRSPSSSLRLAVDRRSDGSIDQTLAPSAIVADGHVIDADYDGPRLRVTGRRAGARVRVRVTAVDPAGVAGIYVSAGGRPLTRYRGPFRVAAGARVLVLAGDGLGNTSVFERRARALPQAS